MLYYSGDWILRRNDGYSDLLYSPYDVKLNKLKASDGLTAQNIIIAVPTEDDLAVFKYWAASRMSIVNWNTASQKEYRAAKSFIKAWKEAPGAIIDGFLSISEANEDLIEKRNQQK
jgi:hypothetical protein